MCSEIIILGYGIPPADWTVIRLLTSCKKEKSIEVVLPPKGVNCNDKGECNRCEKLNLSNFCNVPEPVKKYWDIFNKRNVQYKYPCVQKYFNPE